MKLKVELKNRGYIDGVMKDEGDIVIIDASKFTETWMRKIEVVKEKKKKGLLDKIFGA